LLAVLELAVVELLFEVTTVDEPDVVVLLV
jgi:hypothetical protein